MSPTRQSLSPRRTRHLPLITLIRRLTGLRFHCVIMYDMVDVLLAMRSLYANDFPYQWIRFKMFAGFLFKLCLLINDEIVDVVSVCCEIMFEK